MSCKQTTEELTMASEKTGLAIGYLVRVPLVVVTIFLLFLLGKSSIKMITAFAVPFGFSSGATTAFSTVAVIFYLSIAILVGKHLFRSGTTD